jgi:hypothetical protein
MEACPVPDTGQAEPYNENGNEAIYQLTNAFSKKLENQR